MRISDQLDRLEQAERLDRVVTPVQRIVRLLPPGRLRDTLHGVWLGHPLHPVLVQVPLGAWLSAAALDVWQSADDWRAARGRSGAPGLLGTLSRPSAAATAERTARRLVAFGSCAAVPAALAGWADWSEQHEQQMRVGVVHALSVGVADSLYIASLAVRNPRRARLLRFAGLGAAAAGGLLGGHISFRQAGGANHAEAVPHLVPAGWQDLTYAGSLPDGPSRVLLGDVPLLVVKHGTEFNVLADWCSHMSAPLSDGEFADGCVTCPWHGSVFRLADGSVARGPATAPQPVFRTRVHDGVLQVCLPGAG
jgi:nitrite reductase/ring-hydroxylating ferredoxin subunit